MASRIGERLTVSLFGQSHGEMIGAVIDGLPAGERIDAGALARFMERRAPGRQETATKRFEPDIPRIVSGVVGDITCGAPLCLLIENTDTRSSDYEALRDLPRPGHADYTAHMRYKGRQDVRGGGHFSGRLTAPLCAAGGIALQMLARRNIAVGAHIASIADVRDEGITPETLHAASEKPFPTLSDAAGEAMRCAIAEAARDSDSVGGVIECMAVGMPAGVGEPMFDGVENRLAAALFGIPAVRGVEFGAGFAAAGMRGSAHNDSFAVHEGKIVTQTNHHGGVLGGITSGMPIVFRVAIKPTPSIAKEQRSVRLSSMEAEPLCVKGRHDPCIVPRAVACVEAVAAIVLLDMLLMREGELF